MKCVDPLTLAVTKRQHFAVFAYLRVNHRRIAHILQVKAKVVAGFEPGTTAVKSPFERMRRHPECQKTQRCANQCCAANTIPHNTRKCYRVVVKRFSLTLAFFEFGYNAFKIAESPSTLTLTPNQFIISTFNQFVSKNCVFPSGDSQK